MITAFTLALRQLNDPRVLSILLRCVVITLAAFVVIGGAAWYAIDALLAQAGLNAGGSVADADAIRGVASLVLVIIGGWLLWRILALAVLQFHADEFIAAVEARYYPTAHGHARALGWNRELALGLRGAARALGYNLLALPVAAVLLVTGIGPAVVFIAVNALLLGRELTEMVWLRHAPVADAPIPLARATRLTFGAIVAVLFAIPFVNFLAPFLGAAGATHLVHRSGAINHAT